jgi:hypothetical protein
MCNCEELRSELSKLQHEMAGVRRDHKRLRRVQIKHSEYIDTVSSPLWKRCIWWCEGFYFRKVGKWAFKNWIPTWPEASKVDDIGEVNGN